MILQFAVSFLAVFFKGFQQQNTVGGKYKTAFAISYIIAALEVSVITLITVNGYSSILPVGSGGAIGVVLSMYIYRRIDKK